MFNRFLRFLPLAMSFDISLGLPSGAMWIFSISWHTRKGYVRVTVVGWVLSRVSSSIFPFHALAPPRSFTNGTETTYKRWWYLRVTVRDGGWGHPDLISVYRVPYLASVGSCLTAVFINFGHMFFARAECPWSVYSGISQIQDHNSSPQWCISP